MAGRRKSARTLGEHGIFGDEEAAQLRTELDELRTGLVDLNDRVHAQFTTIAAHAEIAREQTEFAREEARADLDRTRDSMIELIESVRGEATGLHVPGARPGPSTEAQHARFEAIEQRLTVLAADLERCFRRQAELADTMAAFLDTVLAQQTQTPTPGLTLA